MISSLYIGVMSPFNTALHTFAVEESRFLVINADTKTFVSITACIIRQLSFLLPFLHEPT